MSYACTSFFQINLSFDYQLIGVVGEIGYIGFPLILLSRSCISSYIKIYILVQSDGQKVKWQVK